MKLRTRLLVVAAGLLAVNVALAQAPAGSTGQCKDGTYTTAASKKGACRGHKGVQTWFAASAAPASASTSASTSQTRSKSKKAAASESMPPSTSTTTASSGPAPSGATGQCKDGSYTTAPSKRGACRGHKGVQTWFAASASPAAAPMIRTAPSSSAAPASAPSPAPMTSPAPARNSSHQSMASMAQAPGGGPGMVWVNSATNIYHCSGSRFYGKTKQGKYMTEADAKASGARPDHNHPCTK